MTIGILYQKIKIFFSQKYQNIKMFFAKRYKKINNDENNIGNDDIELQNEPHEMIHEIINEQIKLENNNKINLNNVIEETNKTLNNISELNDDDNRKRRILLNKIYLLFENNKFILDTKRTNIYENDIFHKLSRIQNSTDKIYDENINILKKHYDEHTTNLSKYDSKSNKEINFILQKYFLNFGSMYPEDNYKCKKCRDDIYVYEKLCYTCNKIYFEKCDNIEHSAKNSILPPMKKYSNDFIVHIQKCLLESSDIINEMYDFLNE
jgi:hypothetical protein